MDALPPLLRLGLSAFVYVLAYAAGIALFVWAARRRGIAMREVGALAAAALLGGLVAASAFQLLASGEPGKTVLGGIAGGWIAVILAKRRLGVRRPLGDAFAFAIAGGEAIGRIGCFLAGCCYGKIASVPWAVHDHGELRHPTQLYSALAALVTLAVIAQLDRRRTLPDGALFFVQGALFCAFRFAVEFYREAPAYGAFTLAQYACLAGFVFFAYRLHRVTLTRVTLRVSPSKGERKPSPLAATPTAATQSA